MSLKDVFLKVDAPSKIGRNQIKNNSEIKSVFLLDNAKKNYEQWNTSYVGEEKTYRHCNTDGVFILRNSIISEIKMPWSKSFQTLPPSISNYTVVKEIVNNLKIDFVPADKWRSLDEIEKVNIYSGTPVTLRAKTGADL